MLPEVELILMLENATIRLERIFSKSTDEVSSEPLAAMASRLISIDGMRIVSLFRLSVFKGCNYRRNLPESTFWRIVRRGRLQHS